MLISLIKIKIFINMDSNKDNMGYYTDKIDRDILKKYFCSKRIITNSQIIELISDYNNKRPTKVKESVIQKECESIFGGTHSKCISGVCDILTETQVIEIKRAEKWRDAIGQLLSYAVDKPTHEKILILFGYIDIIDHIKNTCKSSQINIIQFEDLINRKPIP